MAQGIFTLKQVNQAILQNAWSGFIAPKFVEYLVVAGGGSGATLSTNNNYCGGGGAGGLLTGIVPVVAGNSYTVTVGGGGASGSSGTNSVFGSLTAIAGGRGGGFDSPFTSASAGVSGGSGGGGGGAYYGGPGGQGTAGQGNAGAYGYDENPAVAQPAAGGGGGAGSVGLTAFYGGSSPATFANGGRGGSGIASAISGTNVIYAGGGGGGTGFHGSGGLGGVGGGGDGGTQTVSGKNANVNTGSGGGGAGGSNTGATSGGIGGSGIVIVRYPGTVQFYTGGTVNYANGYIIHTFYSNGTLAPTTPTQYSNTYQISRSLRFNAADTTYLSRTVSTSNRRTWTFSAWIKKSTEDTFQGIFSASPSSPTTLSAIRIQSNTLSLIAISEGSYQNYIFGTMSLADPSAWYHIVVVADTTNGVSTDRYRLYVNGNRLAVGAESTVARNFETYVNSSSYTNHIGGINDQGTMSSKFTGYMAEIHFIDGQALTPSSFGEYDINTGVWEPKAYGGSYGTNGVYLNFSNNTNTTAATLGADSSGNGNNWTPNNFSVTAGAGNDSHVDTPTPYGTDTGVGGEVRGNYCTLNPKTVHYATLTYTNGNLEGAATGGGWSGMHGTIGVSTGKWYWEVTIGAGTGIFVGIARTTTDFSSINPQNISGTIVYFMQGGNKRVDGTDTAYGASGNVGDTIGVALNLDANTITFYKSNVSQGAISLAGTTLSGTIIVPFNAVATSPTNAICNFGQRPFAYTAPSGFKALCTTNLPTPTIGATAATQANKFFAPITYTGNGTTQNINVGFQPDFVWNKCRSTGYSHYLQDTVRGANKVLRSATTGAETTETDAIMSFISSGFIAGGNAATNYPNDTYVAWNWKAGGTAVTNTAGSITSTVSANPTAGFSIVTYTNASSGTVGHGLGVAPAMVIYKDRTNSGVNWIVLHQSLTNMSNYYLRLNTTDGVATGITLGGSPTSSVIYTNTNVIQNGAASLAYCFAEVEGYSKFGSYVGNGSTDGPFQHCGFRPAFIMWKNAISASQAGNWFMLDDIRDPLNTASRFLVANGADAESNIGVVDFLSNGFKLKYAGGGSVNFSTDTYIFMAFARNPFKYSLAR